MKDSTEWSPRLLVYGDFGNVNSQSMARIQQETQRGHFDAVLHVGDIAYNLDTSNGRIGDAFMRQIETVAAYVPYMTCPGNHEAAYNFSHYKYRFNMPGDEQKNMYYSFNMGPAHIISFSTEYYYEVSYGWSQIFTQYFWLEKDLQEANKPENRAKRPWIIVFGHRPMYCSNADDPTMCSNIDNYVRVGIPHVHAFSLEDLFYKYGVDLHFYGHEHSYERMWPVYNRKVCNGSNDEPYHNPPAPVHVVTGSAGCDEGEDPFISNGLPWSAFRSDDYGYTRMNIINSTHLYLEQVSDDKDGAVIDKMLLIKEKHGMGTFNCH
ncbi:acid phosphatase type 7 isoform X2 [Lingula anatina]|nr:acid phosphatase type 7 isoform X2 [Lingula anatina]|eukprot:XP_013400248.1 acid phosphatase type 7 isoform X2 [Lingula anatina]